MDDVRRTGPIRLQSRTPRSAASLRNPQCRVSAWYDLRRVSLRAEEDRPNDAEVEVRKPWMKAAPDSS
jgi:hypothetical protein